MLVLQLGRLKGARATTANIAGQVAQLPHGIDVARDCRDAGASGISAEFAPIRHMLNLSVITTGDKTVHQLAVGRELHWAQRVLMDAAVKPRRRAGGLVLILLLGFAAYTAFIPQRSYSDNERVRVIQNFPRGYVSRPTRASWRCIWSPAWPRRSGILQFAPHRSRANSTGCSANASACTTRNTKACPAAASVTLLTMSMA
jgi:hypothetical protein